MMSLLVYHTHIILKLKNAWQKKFVIGVLVVILMNLLSTLGGVTGFTFCCTLGSDGVVTGYERTGDSVGGLKDGELFVVRTSM